MMAVIIMTRRDDGRCYGDGIQNSKRYNEYAKRACFFCQAQVTHTVRRDARVWYTPPRTDDMVSKTPPEADLMV